MKVLIIEDEQLTAQRLQNMLNKYDTSIEILAVLPSVAESLAWFKQNDDPDLVFMDIHLEDDQCFSIFEKINFSLPVVFTTAYDEYMIKAFKVNSIDYLMKPVNYEELVNAIQKYLKLQEQSAQPELEILLQSLNMNKVEYKRRFLVSTGSKLLTINIENVSYFYGLDKLTFAVTTENQHLPVDYSLDKLVQLVDPRQFFRVNRQIMIGHKGINHIHVYPKGRIKLDLKPVLKEEVFVSRDRITAFKNWLGK
jgi:DNA-binding LytR/AlgR family response regulator